MSRQAGETGRVPELDPRCGGPDALDERLPGVPLLADVHDPGAFTVISEWTGHESFDRFLDSREYGVLRGMTILMAADVRFSVDGVVTRAAVSTHGDRG